LALRTTRRGRVATDPAPNAKRFAAPTTKRKEPHMDTLPISYRPVDGVDVRIANSDGDHPETMVLTCPWPESLFAFQSTWPMLSQNARLVAVDLPGFGGSERRDDLLTPQAMGEFLLRLIDQWEIESPHIFGPDIGTAAVLFAAGRGAEKIRSVIVGSGASAYPMQIGGGLKDIVEAPDLSAFDALNPRDVIASSMELLEKFQPSAEALEDYMKSYEGDRFTESCRYVRSYDAELPVLGDLLAQIATPALVLQGDHDPYVPPANGDYLHARLPNSRLHQFKAGHFFWEDTGKEFAALASAWIGGEYKDMR
jgi:pimeloyl-ACP methyl ester carboxylesterase